MRTFLFMFLMTMGLNYSSIGQISIHIVSLAENTPEDASLYFAGNINGWNPGDTDFILEKRNDGDYWIDLPAGSGQIEFKFTRGSWASVESNGNGGFRPNRTYTYGNGDTLDLSILGWEDLDGGGGSNSTANEQVMIWDTAMEIPQLGSNRRVWIYLPQDYENTNKFYPVLYMHDGQNVFDASTSFAGEWKVDESLTDLENAGHRGVIVVAVDNGGSHRIDEYSPFTNPTYGGGEGDLYLDFIVETLKPKVDSTFRTLKEAKHTGIMGSSMGGLISHYAHFRNPEVFGRAGIFSPSYWFSNEYFTYTETVGKTDSSKLFILAGALESSIATGAQSMFDQLITMGYEQDELQLLISADGNHSEWFWAREFKDAFLWLFPNDETLEVEDQKNSKIKVYPNPAKGKLNIEGQGSMDVRLLDLNGRLVERHEIVGKGILDLAHVKAGTTLLLSVERSGKQCYQQVIMTIN